MASIRENWWVPQLRSKVKKAIKKCNVCKIYSAKPYGPPATLQLPEFRTEAGRPFEVTGVDFAGPLVHKIRKKEEGKCYVLIFTCATSRAVHLELTHSQTAEEFQEKLNSFVTRKTRPRRIISDNATVFKATVKWIKVIRRSECLQNYLATQEIHWRFNLAKSPWWGGMYERLIKEIKKTLYKTLGRTHLTFGQLETVVMDIVRHLNNRPLTYVESNNEDEQILTPNILLWGQNAHAFEEPNGDEDEITRVKKRLELARQHAWSRWRNEYVHGLMEFHKINRGQTEVPQLGEVVLILGEEKNRGRWMRGKVLRHVTGKDGVIRGVILLHKGNHIERPIQLVCSLEIRSAVKENLHNASTEVEADVRPEKRKKRLAAKNADKIRLCLQDSD